MTSLDNWTADLNSYKFGRGTDVHIEDIDFGQGDIVSGDVNLVNEDGTLFTTDNHSGREITLLLFINLPKQEALSLLGPIKRAWNSRQLRDSPARVSQLTYTRAGRTRRVFGRPRKIASSDQMSSNGYIPITATFQCADNHFYDVSDNSIQVNIVPPSVSGITSPLVAPVTTTVAEKAQGDFTVTSDDDTWFELMLHGPIDSDCEIELLGQWVIEMHQLKLAYDNYLIIDPRHWSRKVKTRFGVNQTGAFSADSPRLSEIKVPPGDNSLILRGTDQTGTAYVIGSWMNGSLGE